MATLEKRVQVLFDPEQYAALEAEARARNMSVGALIRLATEQLLDAQRNDARQSLRDMFARAAEDEKQNSYPSFDWEEAQTAYEHETDPFYREAQSKGDLAA